MAPFSGDADHPNDLQGESWLTPGEPKLGSVALPLSQKTHGMR